MTAGRRNVMVYRSLHPAVVGALVGTVAWTVLAAWLLFDDGAGSALSLAVVTGFALAFVGTPIFLWRAGPQTADKDERRVSLATWLEGEFAAGDGTIATKDAAVMVLLLPAAGAIGITAVSFVAWLAAAGLL